MDVVAGELTQRLADTAWRSTIKCNSKRTALCSGMSHEFTGVESVIAKTFGDRQDQRCDVQFPDHPGAVAVRTRPG